MTPHALIK